MSQEPTVQNTNENKSESSKTSLLGCAIFPFLFIVYIILAFCGYGLAGVLGFGYWLPGKYWDATIVVDSVSRLPDYGILDKSGLLDEYPADWWDKVSSYTRTVHARFLKSEIDTHHIAILTVSASRYSSISDSAYVPPVVKSDTLQVRLDYNDTGIIPFNTMSRKKLGFHIDEIKDVKQVYARYGQLDNMDVFDESSASGMSWMIGAFVVIGLVLFFVVKRKFKKKK